MLHYKFNLFIFAKNTFMSKMGREPIEDKKERLTIFVRSSKIKEHGGKKTLQKHLAALAENGNLKRK